VLLSKMPQFLLETDQLVDIWNISKPTAMSFCECPSPMCDAHRSIAHVRIGSPRLRRERSGAYRIRTSNRPGRTRYRKAGLVVMSEGKLFNLNRHDYKDFAVVIVTGRQPLASLRPPLLCLSCCLILGCWLGVNDSLRGESLPLKAASSGYEVYNQTFAKPRCSYS